MKIPCFDCGLPTVFETTDGIPANEILCNGCYAELEKRLDARAKAKADLDKRP